MLSATMSHEMMTPLNAVINMTTLIEKNVEDKSLNAPNKKKNRIRINTESKDNAVFRYVQVVKYSAKIMHYLISSMIDLDNIQNNQFVS